MRRAGAVAWIFTALAGPALAACAMTSSPQAEQFMRMPREIRTGAADMVIERVEPGVSREEVAAAVQALVATAPMCFPWPGVWLDASTNRRIYYARFDLMARDWGEDAAVSSEARLQEFVDMGFLTKRERPDLGPRVVEYTLTSEGAAYLRGSPYGGERPSFCPPSQRRVVEITEMEFGQYPCGSLRVHFRHIADDWPHWARTESARTRIASAWRPVGEVGEGVVSLSRQWFRLGQVPDGRTNGELRSLCYDSARQEIVGDDLNLSP
jgi:hypothetical protein